MAFSSLVEDGIKDDLYARILCKPMCLYSREAVVIDRVCKGKIIFYATFL